MHTERIFLFTFISKNNCKVFCQNTHLWMGGAGLAASTPFNVSNGGTVASGIWWQQRVEVADCVGWMVLGGGNGQMVAAGGWQLVDGSCRWWWWQVVATTQQHSL